MIEQDPNGKSPHQPGAKMDADKPMAGEVLGGFAEALQAVVEVGTHGAKKYTLDGWRAVDDAERRYTSAMLRHWLAEHRERMDDKSGLTHAAHVAWNALARLHFILQQNRVVDKVCSLSASAAAQEYLRGRIRYEINNVFARCDTQEIAEATDAICALFAEHQKRVARAEEAPPAEPQPEGQHLLLTEELQPWDEFYKWLPTRARNGLRTLNDGKQLVDWQDFSVALESDRWGNKVDTRDVFDVHGAFAKCQGVGWLTSRQLVEHMVRAGWPFRNKDQKTWPYDQ